MTKRFQPASLFQAWAPPREPYPTFEAELDAVRAGAKGMAMFSFPLAYLTSGGADYVRVMRLAFQRGLVLVVQDTTIPGLPAEPSVFVARPEELWRIPARDALWKTAFADGRWSDAAEAQDSLLLGYTPRQRAAWLAHLRERYAAWGSPTVYALLTRAQRRVVIAMGQRCFGTIDELRLFRHLRGVLKPTALRLLPAGLTLARVGLGRDGYDAAFGGAEGRGLVTATVAAEAINAALASNVQLLTRKGWR